MTYEKNSLIGSQTRDILSSVGVYKMYITKELSELKLSKLCENGEEWLKKFSVALKLPSITGF